MGDCGRLWAIVGSCGQLWCSNTENGPDNRVGPRIGRPVRCGVRLSQILQLPNQCIPLAWGGTAGTEQAKTRPKTIIAKHQAPARESTPQTMAKPQSTLRPVSRTNNLEARRSRVIANLLFFGAPPVDAQPDDQNWHQSIMVCDATDGGQIVHN